MAAKKPSAPAPKVAAKPQAGLAPSSKPKAPEPAKPAATATPAKAGAKGSAPKAQAPGASGSASVAAKPATNAPPAPKAGATKGAPVKSAAAKPSAPASAAPVAAKPAAQAAAKPAGKPNAPKPVDAKGGSAKPPVGKSAPASVPPALSTAPQQRSLTNMKSYFDRTLSILDESDSSFAPMPGMFTVAQQVAHAAQTYDWFREGAFARGGFRMDFPAMEAEVRKATSLSAAKAALDQAHARLLKVLQERPAADWYATIAKDTIMGGAPRLSIVEGLADHTAHHRGALAVYARLRGKTPPMPYM